MRSLDLTEDENGKVIGISVSQSGMAQFMRCPESLRRLWLAHHMPDHPDATPWWVDVSALVGSAVHEWVHSVIEDFQGMRVEMSANEVHDWFWATIEEDEQGYRWGKYTREQVATRIDQGLAGATGVINEMYDLGYDFSDTKTCIAERHFTSSTYDRVIYHGTPDLIIMSPKGTWEIFDWKTGSVKKEWQLSRHGLQDKLYAFLAGEQLGIFADSFTWHWLNEGQVTTVMLDPDPTGWFRRIEMIGQSMLTMVEEVGMFTPWPLSINDWHCSPKWCPSYAAGQCQGIHPAATHQQQMD